jgi:hypothetical protein
MQRVISLRRLTFLRDILRPVWVRCILPIWGVVASYDVLRSQFFSDWLTAHTPRALDILTMTGPLLPWWGWLLILFAILAIASFEHAYHLHERLTKLSKSPLRIDFCSDADIRKLDDQYLMFSVHLFNNSDQTISDVRLEVAGETRGLFRSSAIPFDHAHGQFHDPHVYSCEIHPHRTMPVTLFVHEVDNISHGLHRFTLTASAKDIIPSAASFEFDSRMLTMRQISLL